LKIVHAKLLPSFLLEQFTWKINICGSWKLWSAISQINMFNDRSPKGRAVRKDARESERESGGNIIMLPYYNTWRRETVRPD
jgi:hypothetical protein